jgi:osmotically-inducible protein OsmY
MSERERARLEREMKFVRRFLPVILCAGWLVSFAQDGQQKINAADLDLATRVRQSIIADKSLSTEAHNLKVISRNGVVTLKGPVHSEDEKRAVMSKAIEVVGTRTRVSNQMSVRP